MGALVYSTGTQHTHFHRSPDCSALTSRAVLSVKAFDLEELYLPVPCKRCWPQAPRVKVAHQICLECKQSRPRPCPHNGGVLVAKGRQRFFVWTENAHRYTLANPSQPG